MHHEKIVSINVVNNGIIIKRWCFNWTGSTGDKMFIDDDDWIGDKLERYIQLNRKLNIIEISEAGAFELLL